MTRCPKGHETTRVNGHLRCRECNALGMRRLRQVNPHLNLYDAARRRAREAGIPFTLTMEDVRDLLARGWICSYCDSPVGQYAGGTRPTSITLDRLISALGYTVRNTVVACHACNAQKGDHTPQSLRAWADRIDAVIQRQNPTERP